MEKNIDTGERRLVMLMREGEKAQGLNVEAETIHP